MGTITPKVYGMTVAIVAVLAFVVGTVIVMSQTNWWINTHSWGGTGLHNDFPTCCGCVTPVPASIIFIQLLPSQFMMVNVSPLGYMYITMKGIANNVALQFDIATGAFDTVMPDSTRFAGRVSVADSVLHVTSLEQTFQVARVSDTNSVFNATKPLVSFKSVEGTDMVRPKWADTVSRCCNPAESLGGRGELIAVNESGVGVAIDLSNRFILVLVDRAGFVGSSTEKVFVIGTIREDWTFSLVPVTPKLEQHALTPTLPPRAMSGWVDLSIGAIHMKQDDGMRVSLQLMPVDNIQPTLHLWMKAQTSNTNKLYTQ